LTASATQISILSQGASTTGTIDNISVRELPGAHASQSTSASRPVLSARVNLLERTEEFDNAAWTKGGVTVTANAAVAPDGTQTADLVYPSSSGSLRTIYQAKTGNKVSFRVKAAGKSWAYIQDGGNSIAWFNLATGALGTVAAGYTATIVPTTEGFFVCTVVKSGNFSYAEIGISDADNSNSVTASGTSGIFIFGADLRVANDGVGLPVYQRVTTSTDYDTTGFPLYLRCDGSDDGMVTSSVDFSGTDKMTVFAGVRKLSDAAEGCAVELSSSSSINNGSFSLFAPGTASGAFAGKYFWASRGTTRTIADVGNYSEPITNVLTGIGDISGDSAILRINGTQVASNTADQGTGNFGNYPLYIGRRGGTTLPYNGRLYSLIIRGAQSTATQIAQTENYVNQKTRAF
jgi:hypothetical protein